MVDRITSISERDCKVVESVDTTYPGFIEASRTLVHTANKLIQGITGETDTILAGELLLLAGLSALLYSHGNTPQNMAVHFNGLKVQGHSLSTQSIYVAMDKPKQATNTTIEKHPSPRSVVTQEELDMLLEPLPSKQQSSNEITAEMGEDTSGQIFDARQLQAELDAELPDEVLAEARQFESDLRRFHEEPSMADTPITNLPHPNRSPLQIPKAVGGLHAAYDTAG